jgi:small redox-active disulfide protein 2
MMRIQILGPGCPRCDALEENVRTAVEALGLDARIEKVTDVGEIAGMGVFTTPALAVDGAVRSSGRVLSEQQVEELLQEESSA